MEILVATTTSFIAEKLKNASQIIPGVSLFYELGQYKTVHCLRTPENWVPSGIFKEIEDPMSFVKGEPRMADPSFIEHHNFHIIQ